MTKPESGHWYHQMLSFLHESHSISTKRFGVTTAKIKPNYLDIAFGVAVHVVANQYRLLFFEDMSWELL